jgi:hypothetical protein
MNVGVGMKKGMLVYIVLMNVDDVAVEEHICSTGSLRSVCSVSISNVGNVGSVVSVGMQRALSV